MKNLPNRCLLAFALSTMSLVSISICRQPWIKVIMKFYLQIHIPSGSLLIAHKDYLILFLMCWYGGESLHKNYSRWAFERSLAPEKWHLKKLNESYQPRVGRPKIILRSDPFWFLIASKSSKFSPDRKKSDRKTRSDLSFNPLEKVESLIISNRTGKSIKSDQKQLIRFTEFTLTYWSSHLEPMGKLSVHFCLHFSNQRM